MSRQARPDGPAVAFIHDYNLTKRFVARVTDLNMLVRAFTEHSSGKRAARVAAITAIGGVGKSCLCRELIERSAIKRRFLRIVWFSFYEAQVKTVDYFISELLAQGLRVPKASMFEGVSAPEEMLPKAIKFLETLDTLLVLDGLEVIQFTDDPASANYGKIKPSWKELDRLLRHILNDSSARCLITSRVPLREFESLRGFYHYPLNLFSIAEGAKLLRELGVDGSVSALQSCARALGGHALSLVAAGRYLMRRKLSAENYKSLIPNPEVFRTSSEGERVKRIVDCYRSELDADQEYFLTRLSLHGRSVNEKNFPVVIKNYESRCAAKEELYDNIVQPLIDRGLVDHLVSSDETASFTAHPLMKLAYSTWLEPDTRKRVHEDWARAAEGAPGLFYTISSAESIGALQPFVDATEQYLAAGNWRQAWNIFSTRLLGVRLMELGFHQVALKFTEDFAARRNCNKDWTADESLLLLDRLASLKRTLGNEVEALEIRRQQLSLAREAGSWMLSDVENIVASSLVRAGFVKEAAAVNPKGEEAQGIVALGQGKYVKAVKLLQKAVKASRGHQQTVVAQPLGEALYRAGQTESSRRVLLRGLSLAIAKQYVCCERAILYKLIEMSWLANDVNGAKKWIAERDSLLRRLEAPGVQDFRLLLHEEDFDAAAKELDGRYTSTPADLVEAHLDRASLLLKRRRTEAAVVEFESAIRITGESDFKQLDDRVKALKGELAITRKLSR